MNNNYWDYICYICKPRDIAELHRLLNCWVENHPICMMMSCVGFEVYKFPEPPLLAQQFFQSPPFGCLKIFKAPPQYLHPPPCHIKWTFPNNNLWIIQVMNIKPPIHIKHNICSEGWSTLAWDNKIDLSRITLQWTNTKKWGRGSGGQFHTNHCILSTRASSWCLCSLECGKGLLGLCDFGETLFSARH